MTKRNAWQPMDGDLRLDADGFEYFKNLDSMRRYEAKVLEDDEARHQAFLDSVKDDPEVQAWLASLEEPAA